MPILGLWPHNMSLINETSETAISQTASSFTPSMANSIAFLVINGLTIVVGTLGNLLVVTVIFLQIHFTTVSDLLIANLAAIDLLTAVVLISGGIYRHVCTRMGYCHVWDTVVTVHRILVQFSVTAVASSLLTIAVERFISVAFPFRHGSLSTKKRALIGVLFTWASGIFVTAVFHGLYLVYIQNTYCICLLLITTSIYIYIFSIALKQENKIAAMRVLYGKRPTLFMWERKSAKTMTIVLGMYALCWVPSVMFYSVVRTSDWRFPRMQFWINTVYYLNTASDPFIYSLRSKRFRKAVKKLIRAWLVTKC